MEKKIAIAHSRQGNDHERHDCPEENAQPGQAAGSRRSDLCETAHANFDCMTVARVGAERRHSSALALFGKIACCLCTYDPLRFRRVAERCLRPTSSF